MVEGARLESVYSGNAIAGSNPALSANNRIARQMRVFFIYIALKANALLVFIQPSLGMVFQIFPGHGPYPDCDKEFPEWRRDETPEPGHRVRKIFENS